MNVKKNKKVSTILLAVNAILCFIIAFQIGGKLADAQAKATYKVDGDSPYTAQYPEFKDQLYTTVTPENPNPNQEVTISVAVYSFDINSANITWRKDGKVISSGIGKKNYVFTTGDSGVTTKIDVTIDPGDRPSVSDSFTFSPSEVDLLWQANTYSHPFYKGKNLYTPEASVTIVALPRSATGTIRPQEVVFNWTENYDRKADRSGFGRNTYTFDGPILLRETKIDVETYAPKPGSKSEKQIANAEIKVLPIDAGVILYEDNPALGIMFNKALIGSVPINKSEIKVAAYPYFQTVIDKNNGTEYAWAVDGYRADVAKEQNTITLKKTTGTKGESNVVVRSLIPTKILQTAQNGVSFNFDDSNKTNTFGR